MVQSTPKLLKKLSIVSLATMLSRVLGFAREVIIAYTLGIGFISDAFYAAFTLPNVFRRIFAEGAFSIAFVPIYSEILKKNGSNEAKLFANRIFTILVFSLVLLTITITLSMPFVVLNLLTPGFTNDEIKSATTINFALILFPYIFFVSITAFFSSMLNVWNIYFIPALAPSMLNIVLIIVVATAYALGFDQLEIGYVLCFGVIVSGLAQLILLVHTTYKLSIIPKLATPKLDINLVKFSSLIFPAILSGGVIQINILVGRIIASAQDGAIAILNFADRLYQLPLGVIGIAIGVVLLPELSKSLAAKQWSIANDLQNTALQFSLFFTLPATVGLVILAFPIVNVLYERGAFDAQASMFTSEALIGFSIGLPAYVSIKIFQSSFFARQDTRTPLIFAIVSVAVNILISTLLFSTYGHIAIAIGTAFSAWCNLLLLVIFNFRRHYFSLENKTAWRIAVIVFSSSIMALVLMATLLIHPNSSGGPFLVRTAYLAFQIVLAVTVYIFVATRFPNFKLGTILK